MGRIGPVIISACLAHDRASNARANWMEEIDRYGLAWVDPEQSSVQVAVEAPAGRSPSAPSSTVGRPKNQ
jgi:hypothetical protein